MKTLLAAILIIVLAVLAFPIFKALSGTTVLAQATQPAVKTNALHHTVKDIDGKDYDLAQLKGKVVLFVNVASKCGFTKQYTGLEAAYEKYKDKGFIIVGFPANNFKSQEPGTDEEIKAFCTDKYSVTFPIMSKVSVKGDDIHPVYKDLTVGTGEFSGEIAWNFTKFLIGRDGETIAARFPSRVAPEDPKFIAAIESALEAK